DLDGLLEQPATVRVEGDARLWKACGERRDRLGLLPRRKNPALQLEVAEPVALEGRFRLAHDGVRVEGGVVSNLRPGIRSRIIGGVGQVGPAGVADEEEVAECVDLIALLSVAEKRGNRNTEVLAQ